MDKSRYIPAALRRDIDAHCDELLAAGAAAAVKIGTKFITAEGREARVTNVKGDWAMVAVRLRPRHLVRKLWKLDDIRAAVAAKHTYTEAR